MSPMKRVSHRQQKQRKEQQNGSTANAPSSTKAPTMLPPELLKLVLQYICDRHTLNTFSLTCKAFRAAALSRLFAKLDFRHGDEKWLETGANEVSDAALRHVKHISALVGSRTFYSPYEDQEFDDEENERIDRFGRSLLSRLTNVSDIRFCVTMGGLNGRLLTVRLATCWAHEVGMFEALRPATSSARQPPTSTVSLFEAEGLNLEKFHWHKLVEPISAFKSISMKMTLTQEMLKSLPLKPSKLDMGAVDSVELELQANEDPNFLRLSCLPPVTSLVLNSVHLTQESLMKIICEHASSIHTLDITGSHVRNAAVYRHAPITMPLLKTLNVYISEDMPPTILRGIIAPNLHRMDIRDFRMSEIAWLARLWDTLFTFENFPNLKRIELCVAELASNFIEEDLAETQNAVADMRNTSGSRKQQLVVGWHVNVEFGCPFEGEDDEENEVLGTQGLDRFQDMLAIEAWRARLTGLRLHFNNTYAEHSLFKEASPINLPALDELALHFCYDRDCQQELDGLTRALKTSLLKTLTIDILEGPSLSANFRHIEKFISVLPQLEEVRLRPLLEAEDNNTTDDCIDILTSLMSRLQKGGIACSVNIDYMEDS